MTVACNIAAHDIIFGLQCQRKNKIFNTLLKFFLLWALLVPASAQVYKWVDEKGGTHYGEHPPQGRKVQEVEQRLANPGPATGKAAQPDWKEKELEFRGRRIDAEKLESKNEQQQAANREACRQARGRLGQLKLSRAIFRLDEKGERIYQSEEQRQAYIAQQERQIAERCH